MIQNYLAKKMKRSMIICSVSFVAATFCILGLLLRPDLKEGPLGVIFILSISFLMFSMNFFEKRVVFEIGDLIKREGSLNSYLVVSFELKTEVVELKREDKTYFIKMNQLGAFQPIDKR